MEWDPFIPPDASVLGAGTLRRALDAYLEILSDIADHDSGAAMTLWAQVEAAVCVITAEMKERELAHYAEDGHRA